MSNAVATIKDVDEYGPIIEWHQHWSGLKGCTLHLAQPAQAVDVERQWREMLAIYVAGPMLYTDDGELSDATREPAIDFLRDSADTVARKLADRSRAISGEKAGPVGDGWKLAMFVLQIGLYDKLPEEERAVCDALVQQNPYIPASPAPDKEG